MAAVLAGCNFELIGRRPLGDRIRNYLYASQPSTGEEFVAWATENLSDYTPREIYDALGEQGAFQAQRGHPNVVGVLSFCAKAWAEEYGFEYDPYEWVVWNQEAMANLRRPGRFLLWPGATPF